MPLTLLVIEPVNRQLMSESERLTEAEATVLLASWARLHAVRTLLGLTGFVVAAALTVVS